MLPQPRVELLASGLFAWLLLPDIHAQTILVQGGAPQAVILTKPSPPGYIQLAAQEVQEHVQRMTGALLPIAVVGSEASYPGKSFIYVGASTATTAAGINTAALTIEHYVIRTIGSNLYIVGARRGEG